MVTPVKRVKLCVISQSSGKSNFPIHKRKKKPSSTGKSDVPIGKQSTAIEISQSKWKSTQKAEDPPRAPSIARHTRQQAHNRTHKRENSFARLSVCCCAGPPLIRRVNTHTFALRTAVYPLSIRLHCRIESQLQVANQIFKKQNCLIRPIPRPRAHTTTHSPASPLHRSRTFF